jgi:hypothetical protein
MLYRCGEQYRRRYGEGERLPPGIALVRGKSVHSANERNLVQKLETGELLSVAEVRDLAADSFDKEVKGGGFVIDGEYAKMPVRKALDTAKDEAVDLSGLHAEQVAPSIQPTAIEVRIELPPSQALEVPFISILDVIDDGTKIRDTKTTRKSPPSEAAHLSDQLTSQDLAYRARYHREPEELSLDYLVRTPSGKLTPSRLTTHRSKADLGTFLRRAQAALRMIEAEVFLPAPQDAWVCSERWCGYTSTCPYYRGRSRPTT